MAGQDNRATAHPIYYVEQERIINGLDPVWGGEIAWFHCDSEEPLDETDPDLIAAKEEYEHTGEEPEEYTRTGIHRYYEKVQPFFSLKAAEEYIRANAHNLRKPRVYVDSAHINYEWQAVRKALMGRAEREECSCVKEE